MRFAPVLALAAVVACSKGESGKPETQAGADPRNDAAAPTPIDASAPLPTKVPRHEILPTAAAAFGRILERAPRVLGVGEYHQTNDTAGIESAVAIFEAELLDLLGATTSDLVIETYISEGKCGEAEKVVTETVRETTERPATVENELTRLIDHSKKLGIQPHVLRMSCEDFEDILAGGEVDFEKKLLWVTRELARVANSAVEYRDGRGKQAPDHDPKRATIAVYSGAFHNAIEPLDGLEGYSYVPALVDAVGDGYVEVDLYVPELVAGKKTAEIEPWYPLLDRAGKDHVLLIERSPRSYIILLQRGRVASNARK